MSRLRWRVLAAVTVSAPAIASTVSGAQPPSLGRHHGRIQLPPASDSIRHAFELVTAVRELSDGRVLVSDERATQLFVADFRTGTVRSIGRSGRGPAEYQQVGRLWPIGRDSTIHKEPYSPRLILIVGDEIITTFGAGDATVRRMGVRPVLGADSMGRVLFTELHRDTRGAVAPPDSLHVVRLHLRTGALDTVTRTQSQAGWSEDHGVPQTAPPTRAPGGSAGGRPLYSVAIYAPDQVALTGSGWIAVARARPYRVDWCSPAGRCTTGPVLASELPTFTAQAKRLYLRRAERMDGWPPTSSVEEAHGWPDVVPPFTSPSFRLDASPMIVAPGDKVLIERLSLSEPLMTRFDIVDRVLGFIGWIEIPPEERIIGFGARHVYISRTGEDGGQRLQRHRWTPQ